MHSAARMQALRREHGVTLIELIIAMTVVGILTAIAIPNYRSYTLRVHRADAKTGLLAMASSLERCYTRDNVYNGPSCAVSANGPQSSTNGFYLITPTIPADGGSYTLAAVPQGAQADDTTCGSLTLDSLNNRQITGTGSATDCWAR